MSAVPRPAKAKAAERVVEVLEFFDEKNRHATVMDIARRYNRPQSSTSELLASLVGLGLLYKDPRSRSYSLTPRAAILGSVAQPPLVRDGRLSVLVDTLRRETGLGVAVIGMVELNAQIFRWKPGIQRLEAAHLHGLTGGAQEALTRSAVGWLLLSTMTEARREGIIRRLNAEAPDDRKFNHPEMSARIAECAARGYAAGPAGFGVAANVAAILLPREADERPMAIGFVHGPADRVDPAGLVARLRESVDLCAVRPSGAEAETASPMANAA